MVTNPVLDSKELNNVNEVLVFISRFAIILILHFIVSSLLPGQSKLPVLLTSFLAASTINQNPMFVRFKRNLLSNIFSRNSASNTGKIDPSRLELLQAIYDIKQYLTRSKQWNDKRRSLFKMMAWRQQHIVNQANYAKKLNKVDTKYTENYKLLTDLYTGAMERYGVSTLDLKTHVEGTRHNEHYRVIESLCHYSRDWSSLGDAEIQPLLQYIKSQLEGFDLKDYIAVAPGSGLGRVSHELAEAGFHKVHSVEFSMLMALFNEFVYANLEKNDKHIRNTYSIYPFVHNYSNHLSLDNQLRSFQFKQRDLKPENLMIHKQDFTKFNILKYHDKKDLPENLVIVTCFFIDTAENMIDYFDSINKIASNFKGKKLWINVGPLKYGTAAKVELNNEELKIVKESMGWKEIDSVEPPKILGYLTDTKGLWQGYYGVTCWTCEKKD